MTLLLVDAAGATQYLNPKKIIRIKLSKKLPFEFHIVPKGGHGYGMRPGNPAAETWPLLAVAWLRQTLAAKM